MWRCGSLHALFLSFWTKICLIRLWLCYIIGFCSFNVWSVSIDKDCLEVANTHFDYSAWLFSSRGKPYIHLFFFLNESFSEIETNIWHAPCIRKSNFTSRAVLVFLLLLFFFLYFPILFFSEKLTLTENSSSPLFSLFLLFSELVSHDVECFYCCNVTENGRSMLTERLESNDGDQNNEKRVQFVVSTETELLFFFLWLNASKRPDIAQNPSLNLFWVDHHRHDNEWWLRS